MSASAPQSPLRQILENRISELSAEMERLFVDACERGKRESADQLNQAVRRLRQAGDREELGGILVDAAAALSTGAALFRVADGVATGERVRGTPPGTEEIFAGLEIPLPAAAALAEAVASRDPVVALTSPGQVSTAMYKMAAHTADGRVSIFPLVVSADVPALLYAWGNVQASALELLTQVAAASWKELTPPPPVIAPVAEPAPAPLVQIVAAPQQDVEKPAPAAGSHRPSWEQLPITEQQIHLRAQRFARVQTAEMRLQQADEVQAGRAQRNLYHALQKPIDSARESYRQSFLAPCASMVDYLHLEIVRTLANDDPELLGKEYPGPMV